MAGVERLVWWLGEMMGKEDLKGEVMDGEGVTALRIRHQVIAQCY